MRMLRWLLFAMFARILELALGVRPAIHCRPIIWVAESPCQVSTWTSWQMRLVDVFFRKSSA